MVDRVLRKLRTLCEGIRARLKSHFDTGIDEELRFHIEELIRDNVRAGMAPQEARRQALMAFGGLEKAREECRQERALHLLEDLWRDLRYGFRQLFRAPGFTTVVLLTLTVGIGMNAAVFSVVNAVLLRPLPYREPERLVDFQEADESGRPSWVSPPNFLDYRADSQVFEQIAAYTPGDFALRTPNGAEQVSACDASYNLFATLGVAPVLGPGFTADDEDTSSRIVVLSFEFWQQALGGDRAVLGAAIQLDGAPYVIKGVMPPGFRFPYVEPAEVWLPLRFDPEQRGAEMRGSRYLYAVARLKPGISIDQARASARVIAQRIKAQAPRTLNVAGDVVIVGLRDRLVGDARPLLLLLAGAVALVLLIASLNLANLFLTRTLARQKELAIRLATGSGRSRLLRQLLTESVLLSFLGGVAGLLAGTWLARALASLTPADLPGIHDVGLDWRVLVFTTAVSLGTTLVFGLTPAVPALAIAPSQALKQGTGSTPAGRRNLLRSAVVVGEVALSVVLLAGAGLLVRTFLQLRAVPPGFNPDNVLVAEVALPQATYQGDVQRRTFMQALLDRIASIPGVVSAGATSNLPLSGTNMISRFSSPDSLLPAQTPRTNLRSVSAGYFRTMGMRLVRGRLFEERDGVYAKPVAIINEAMVRRYWPGQDPLGKHVVSGFRASVQWEIVGIIGDVKYIGLDREAIPEMFVPFTQLPMGWLRLSVRASREPLQLSAAVRNVVRDLDPDLALQKVRTMDELVADSVAVRRFYMLSLGLFAGVAVLLAAAGIYGVVSHSVTQRTHEIGVRVALGAGARRVLAFVLAQTLCLASCGLALGLAGAFALTRLLSSLLFGVTARDPLTFFVISLLLGVVALVASWLPARRAARLDPLKALRCE